MDLASLSPVNPKPLYVRAVRAQCRGLYQWTNLNNIYQAARLWQVDQSPWRVQNPYIVYDPEFKSSKLQYTYLHRDIQCDSHVGGCVHEQKAHGGRIDRQWPIKAQCL
jgi:hypothetical protein